MEGADVTVDSLETPNIPEELEEGRCYIMLTLMLIIN